MALIQCAECSGTVSDTASACPHCGAPVKSAPVAQTQPQAVAPGPLSWFWSFVIVIAFVAVIFWLFSPSKSEEPKRQPTTTDTSTKPDIDAQTQGRVKAIIESRGLWCGRAVRYYEAPFKSSVNAPVYYAFCDDGNNAVIYYIHMDRSGKVVAVKEG